jgi:hypothetical protein
MKRFVNLNNLRSVWKVFHKDRVHTIKKVEDINALAYDLTQVIWPRCNGFEFKGYLFLNDSADSTESKKYTIFKKDSAIQIETITFGWCTINQARKYIENIISNV